jgi:hypothetical protein
MTELLHLRFDEFERAVWAGLAGLRLSGHAAADVASARAVSPIVSSMPPTIANHWAFVMDQEAMGKVPFQKILTATSSCPSAARTKPGFGIFRHV